MFDPGGGGGYTGTNWSAAPMATIWQAMHNQQTDNHWTLLGGWRRSADLVLQHISAVQNYRENLASAWPPEKSQAAAAYLGRLDNLLGQLRQTYDAAAANYDVFHAATQALTAARRDLEPLVREHQANASMLATFEQAQTRAPAPIRGAQPLRSPVEPTRQAELETRARAIMYGLSSELIAARTQLRQPPVYDPANIIEEPDVGPTHPTASSTRQLGAGTAGMNDQATPTPSAPISRESPPARIPGLILGGAESSLTSPAGPIGPGSAPGSTSPPVPTPLGPPPLGRPIITPPPAMGGSARPVTSPFLPKARTSPVAGVTRPMPPGGVIGAPPGHGLIPPSSAFRPVANVNPIGGVVGPSSPAAHPPVSARASGQTTPTLFPPHGRGPSSDSDSRPQLNRWDPDNPWETATGVPPVLQPAPEPPIDPGPALGLK